MLVWSIVAGWKHYHREELRAMKVMASIILVAAFSTLGTPYVHGEDATDAFVGTWVLETFQNGSDTPKDFTATKEPREILLITGPHFIYGRLSPSTTNWLNFVSVENFAPQRKQFIRGAY